MGLFYRITELFSGSESTKTDEKQPVEQVRDEQSVQSRFAKKSEREDAFKEVSLPYYKGLAPVLAALHVVEPKMGSKKLAQTLIAASIKTVTGKEFNEGSANRLMNAVYDYTNFETLVFQYEERLKKEFGDDKDRMARAYAKLRERREKIESLESEISELKAQLPANTDVNAEPDTPEVECEVSRSLTAKIKDMNGELNAANCIDATRWSGSTVFACAWGYYQAALKTNEAAKMVQKWVDGLTTRQLQALDEIAAPTLTNFANDFPTVMAYIACTDPYFESDIDEVRNNSIKDAKKLGVRSGLFYALHSIHPSAKNTRHRMLERWLDVMVDMMNDAIESPIKTGSDRSRLLKNHDIAKTTVERIAYLAFFIRHSHEHGRAIL